MKETSSGHSRRATHIHTQQIQYHKTTKQALGTKYKEVVHTISLVSV